MNNNKIIEPIGFFVAGITALLSLFLFYSDTGVFLGSLFAGIIAGGLAWMTYIILRWVLLAIRK